MALVPWPDAGSDRDAAVAQLREAIRGRANDSDEAANHLGMVGAAMVEDYAPGAPQPLKDEAVIRFAGYLAQSDFDSIAKESVGPLDVEYATNHANAWRNSGAGMLLTRWKVRRGGVIGGSAAPTSPAPPTPEPPAPQPPAPPTIQAAVGWLNGTSFSTPGPDLFTTTTTAQNLGQTFEIDGPDPAPTQSGFLLVWVADRGGSSVQINTITALIPSPVPVGATTFGPYLLQNVQGTLFRSAQAAVALLGSGRVRVGLL